MSDGSRETTIVYYSSGKAPARMRDVCFEQLCRVTEGLPLISVTQQPWTWPGTTNLCVGDIGVSFHNVYKQILIGAKAATTPIICCAEDDTLYPPSHFERRFAIRPTMFNYNINRWHLEGPCVPQTGKHYPAQFRWRHRSTMATCICWRDDLIKTLEERFARVPQEGDERSWGEPGRFEKVLGITPVNQTYFMTPREMVVQINWGGLGGVRKPNPPVDTIVTDLPGWGRADALWEQVHG